MSVDISRLGIEVKSTGIKEASQGLSGLGTSAANAEKRVQKLTDTIDKLIGSMTNLAKLQGTATQAAAAHINTIQNGTAAMKAMQSSSHATTKTLQQLQSQANKTGNAFGHAHHKGNILNNTLKSMMVAASAYIGVNFAKGVFEAGDAWGMMQAKLKLATGSMQEALQVQGELFDMAQKYRAPLDDMSKLFVRLAPAMDKMGKSTADAKDMVEGVSLALKLGGATAAEASSTMLQFSQAANAGRLNGAEFNAVSENGTLILRALEESLGKTRGELKKMGSDGELTFDLINDAIQKKLPQWRKDFEELPVTLEGAVQRIKNAWLRGIGEMSQDTELNKKLAESLRKLEEALPSIIDKIISAFNLLIDHGDKLAAIISGIIGLKFAHWVTESATAMTIAWKAAQTASVGIAAVGTAAAGAATSAGLLRTALTFLGGPVGVITGLLTAGVVAYQLWGGEAKKASTETTNVVVVDTEKRITAIQKEIDKLNERNKAAGVQAQSAPSMSKEMAGMLQTLEALRKTAQNQDLPSATRDALNIAIAQKQTEFERLAAYETSLGLLKSANEEREKEKKLQEEIGAFWDKYGSSQLKMQKEIDKQREKFGPAFTKEMEAAIRAQFSSTKKLTAAEKELTKAEKDRQKGIEETKQKSEKAALAVENLYESYSKTSQDAINKTLEEAQANEDLVATFGMTKGAIEQVEIARLEEQLAQRSSIGMTLQEIENLEKLIDAKKRNAAARTQLGELETQKKATEETQKEWEKTVDKIDDVFREGFADMLNNGKSAWKSFTKSLATTFKTTVADAIYKMFARRFVVNMVGNVLGAMGVSDGGAMGAVAGAANGASSLMNLGSMASTAYNYGGNLLSALGFGGAASMGVAGATGITATAGTGLGLASAGGGLGLSAGAGGITGITAGSAGASTIGGGLSAGAAAGGTAGTGVMGGISSALSAIPVWGWILLAIIAFKDKLFGHKTVGSGVLGEVSGGEFMGSSYEFQKGGWFRNDRTKTNPLDPKVQSGFDQAVSTIYDSFNNLGTAVGAGANVLKDFNFEFRLALADFDEEGRTKEITRFMSAMSDSMAQAFVDTFRTSVDTGVQAASRYWTNTIDGQRKFATGEIVKQSRASTPLDPYIDDMLRIFDTFKEGLAGVEGSEGKLSEFTSSLFNFGMQIAETNGFIKTFGESVNFVMLESFSKSGESVIDTFSRLNATFAATSSVASVLGKDVDTAFGVIGLVSLEARERLITLAGGIEALSTGTAFFAQNFLTEAEQLAPTIELVAEYMSDLGYASVDTKDEFKNLVKGLNLAEEADQKLYIALMKIAPAFAQAADFASKAAEEAITKAKQASDKLSDHLQARIESTRRDLVDAYERESGALEKILDKFKNFSKSLKAFRDSLLVGSLSNLSPEAKYFELRNRFESTAALAASGDEVALESLQGISEQFLEASKGYFASSMGYTKDFELVRSALEKAASAADARVDVSGLELTLLNKTVAGLITINQSVLSVRDAILALKLAQSSAAGTGGPGGGSVVGGVYTDALGNTPFSAELPTNQDLVKMWYKSNPDATDSPTADAIKYWTDQLSRTDVSQYDVKQAFANSVAAVTNTAPIDIKHFANGGNPDGWAWVGEQGPELAHFGDKAHIYTARQSQQIVSGGDEESKQLLRDVLVELRAANTQRGAATEAQLISQRTLAEKLDAQRRALAAANAD